jgi:hypothetical protein
MQNTQKKINFWGCTAGIYIFAIAVYGSVIIPTLRTVVEPVVQDSREDRVEAMRVLSAANVIIIVCLGAILALQAGQEYARRVEAAALARAETQKEKED